MREPSIIITQDLLRLIAEIDEFKGKWEALKNVSPERLDQLRKVASIESIGSSTRIEGSSLTDREVEELLSNLTLTKFESRDEQEVGGYAEAMDTVFQAYADLRVTENHIRQLHQILLRHSQKDERHRGSYKKLPNHVVAIDQNGKEIGVVFETATPFDMPHAMEDLVRWTNKAIDEESLHPLLIVAVFILIFLAIHPFQDGNGRLSRILTTLLLLRADYAYVPYASLESVIEENKDLYYKALRRTQKSLTTETPDWEPWVRFFLHCLKKQKANLAAKINNLEVRQDTNLPTLSLRIVELLQVHPRLSISEMANLLSTNRNTLKVHLRHLVLAGHIRSHGKGRGAWYSLS